MSYTVIARKYRPQKFEELVGQEPIAETLSNAIKNDKISHAYLFAGPRGVGKTSTARILSKALNCQKGTSAEPCGKCNNCLEITEGNSLDVIEIDGASNNGVNEIRDLKEKVNFAPVKAKYKIYIIDEVHMLTESAFNALLKTLEEPPPHIIFIFATTEPYKIPITVLSRCQRYNFRRITIPEIVNHLKKIAKKETVKFQGDSLFLIAKNSDGSLRDAQGALDQLIAFSEGEITEDKVRQLFGLSDTEIFSQFTRSITKNDIPSGLEIINKIYNEGIDLRQFVILLVEFLRNILFVKIGITEPSILEESQDKIESFRNLADHFETEVLDEMVRYLTGLLNHFRYTTQFKTLLEIGLLNLHNINKKITLKFIYDYIKEFGEEEIKKMNIHSPAEPMKENTSTQTNQTIPSVRSKPAKETTSGSDKETWVKVINKLEEKSKFVGSLLKQGHFKGVKEKTIYISFDKKFNYNNLSNEDNLLKIKEIVKEFFHKDMDLKFLYEKNSQPENNKKLESEPVIQKAREIFKGRIINT
ncbi:MAG: DNA polymerase III subunit gamma/tau [Spirochaetes bacterium]|nr:DNA polymerase III subunit gamma/tau [Spirochaetota bacterium]